MTPPRQRPKRWRERAAVVCVAVAAVSLIAGLCWLAVAVWGAWWHVAGNYADAVENFGSAVKAFGFVVVAQSCLRLGKEITPLTPKRRKAKGGRK